MFDHARNISGEDPEHIEWVHSVAIPKLESMGVKVDVVRSVADYVGWATQPMGKSSQPDRIGKKRVWLLQGMCALNRDGKLKAIRNYYRQFTQPVVQYVGIAIDEPKRLARLEGNKISLLAKYGYTEADAWRKCEEYGLLSPFYRRWKRNDCWFVNCQPTHGFTAMLNKEKRTIQTTKGSKQAGICSEERSMIHPDYARNFICDFILGKVQTFTQQTLF